MSNDGIRTTSTDTDHEHETRTRDSMSKSKVGNPWKTGKTSSERKGILKDERIEIRGFGSIMNRRYKGYTGRNPKTGKAIKVPAKILPFFKVGKELKRRVNS